MLEDFLECNNKYLEWSKQSFRDEGVTPEKNIQKRFWEEKWEEWIVWLHVQKVEKTLRLTYRENKYDIWSTLGILENNVKALKIKSKNYYYYKKSSMHPKSLDFP